MYGSREGAQNADDGMASRVGGEMGSGGSGLETACARIERMLDAFTRETLNAPAEKAVLAHVAQCEDCAARLEQRFAAVFELTRTAPAAEPGPELRQKLYARIAAAGSRPSRATPATPMRKRSEDFMYDNDSAPTRVATTRRDPHNLSIWLSGVAAALIVALLAGVFLASRGQSGTSMVGGKGPVSCGPGSAHVTLPTNSALQDMAMVSPNDGWAVGAILDASNGPATSLILHYSDCAWRQAGTPLPNVTLISVSMDSATDGWASGGSPDGAANVLLHYTGGQWQRVTVPGTDNFQGVFGAIRMLSPNEGWLVVIHSKDEHGLLHYSLLHDHNGVWTAVDAPIGGIADVAPVGNDDAWVIGSASESDGSGVLAHYQAGKWTTMPAPSGAVLYKIHMVSPTDGWVSGQMFAPNNVAVDAKAYTLRYDGASWKVVNPGADANAQRVEMFSDTDGFALGISTPAGHHDPLSATVSLAQHYNGSEWRTVPWAFHDLTDVRLYRAGPDEYWGVATYMVTTTTTQDGVTTGASVGHMALLHYVNGTWTEYGRS